MEGEPGADRGRCDFGPESPPVPIRMDESTAFLCTIRHGFQADTNSRCYLWVNPSSTTYKGLLRTIVDKYPLRYSERAELGYYDAVTKEFCWVLCEDDLNVMFAKNQEFKKVELTVSVVNIYREDEISQSPSTPSIATPSQQPSQHASTQEGTEEGTYTQSAYIDEPEEDEAVSDADDDEKMYPDLVSNCKGQGNDKSYFPVIYDSTDDDEALENVDIDMIIEEEDEDRDRPIVTWSREKPTIVEGTIFPNIDDCKLALAFFAIKREFEYITEKSDPSRLRVHCKFEGCKWRLHASYMKDGVTFQVKVYPTDSHTCPTTAYGETHRPAKRRWICEVISPWLRQDPSIGAAACRKRIQDDFNILLPYDRVFQGLQLAMQNIQGKWNDSFHLLFSFKAELEKTSPDSLVDIDWHIVKRKRCFRRVFVSLSACWKGFLGGCRPYLAVDSTALTGKFKGQLATACAIDGHNWLYPVAYGVIEAESTKSWTWFLQRLHRVIGNPPGLVIHTDACKGLENAVESVFEGVEHRECMRHLATNFVKKFKGPVFEKNLWPAALAYVHQRHASHMAPMLAVEGVEEYLQEHHSKIWTRSKFNDICKVDYVNNNLAESWNSKIRNIKGLTIVDLLDTIRQLIMEKMELRQRIANKFEDGGHQIIPSVVKHLYDRSRGLKLKFIRSSNYEAEVFTVDKNNIEWRYPVNIKDRTCSCRKWQIIGLPCGHALAFILRHQEDRRGVRIEEYIDDCFSVSRFKAAYAHSVPPMVGKHQWEIISPGFKLHPPMLKRPPGRPRTQRIKASFEPGARLGLGPRKRTCKRCGQKGHILRLCKEPVEPSSGSEGEPDEPQAPDDLVGNSTSSTKVTKKKGKAAVKSKNAKKKSRGEEEAIAQVSVQATPLRGVTAASPDSPACNTRSKKRLSLES